MNETKISRPQLMDYFETPTRKKVIKFRPTVLHLQYYSLIKFDFEIKIFFFSYDKTTEFMIICDGIRIILN